jgi:hypothetical protein
MQMSLINGQYAAGSSGPLARTLKGTQMKRILTFLFVLPVFATAQTNGHLPLEIGNAWYFNSSDTPGIQVISDTLISGRSYKKLSTSIVAAGYPKDLYLRVDSNRVYQFYPQAGTEILLYDFTKTTGDTLYSDTAGDFLICYENGLVQYARRTLRQWEFSHGRNCADCSSGETLVDSIAWIDFSGANYVYRLSKVVLQGVTIITDITSHPNLRPTPFDVAIYPNPFNSSAILKYTLPHPGNVQVALYNSLGQQIETAFQGYSSSGDFTLQINGTTFSSGLYYCRVTFDHFAEVKKLLLLK